MTNTRQICILFIFGLLLRFSESRSVARKPPDNSNAWLETHISTDMQCNTCTFSNFARNGNKPGEGLSMFDKWCKSSESPTNYTKCHDTNSSCVGIHFDAYYYEFTIRACLSTPPLLGNDTCAYLTGAKENNLSKQVLLQYFPEKSNPSVRFCTCSTNRCNPFDYKLTKSSFNGTAESLNALYAIFKNTGLLEIPFRGAKIATQTPATRMVPDYAEESVSRHPKHNNALPATTPNVFTNQDISKTKNFPKMKPKQIFPNASHSSGDQLYAASSGNSPSGSQNATKNFTTGFVAQPDNEVTESSNFQAPETENMTTTTLTMIVVPVIALTAILTIVVGIFVYRRKSMPLQEVREELGKFYSEEVSHSRKTSMGMATGKNKYFSKYNKTVYEIGADVYEIDESKIISTDEHKKVCCGVILHNSKPTGVFAKMPTEKSFTSRTLTTLNRLVQDIKTMSYLGTHENLVDFYGASTENLKGGWVCVFTERCGLGSLHTYLKNVNAVLLSDSLDSGLAKILQKWTQDITNGMQYLVSKNIVHGDLQTKNVFLDSNKNAKLANFEFSRSTKITDNFALKHLQPTSWQWMSPELLRDQKFSEKSDVWAFGVTIWEMYTLGNEPFPGLAWPSNFATQLERGLRLDKPKYVVEEVYLCMIQCWSIKAECRPSFIDLQGKLGLSVSK